MRRSANRRDVNDCAARKDERPRFSGEERRNQKRAEHHEQPAFERRRERTAQDFALALSNQTSERSILAAESCR
jgi:hypothetical protein